MKKWLPYLVAAVLGLGVAIVAFGPGMGGGKKEKVAVQADGAGKKPVKVVNMGADGVDIARSEGEAKTPAEVVAEARANPIPPPGTLRPLNQGEIAHQARLARPYNKRYAHVASFWNRAAQLIGPTDMELAKECSQMTRYLRDQGNLDGDELDVTAALAKEDALVAKLRAANKGNAELTSVLDYIEATSKALAAGKDPLEVPKPGKTASGE